jgi:hypothetical protein
MKRVQGIDRILGGIDEAENGPTGDALSLGGAALKGGGWLVGVEYQHKQQEKGAKHDRNPGKSWRSIENG